MTYLEFAQIVGSVTTGTGTNTTSVPFAYYQFTADTAKEPQFICYYFTQSDDFGADNINYQPIRRAVIELYTDQKDFTLEQAVEALLTSNELVYAKDEAFIDSEQLHLTSYETEVIISG